MKLTPLSLVLVLAATVTACQKDGPSAATAPADTGATAAEAAEVADPMAEVVWDDSAAPVAGTRVEINPDPTPFCEGSRQVVEVEWDVAAAEPVHLQLWVEGAPGRRKLWTATKALTDSKRTGPWATEGMRFIALDAKSKRVINSATVTAADCP
ncbi:hypothetical protein [Luteimonas arsenica]|uniref:hypothetical protein n=1 Tax=Luteimonas arsenica TaxID=1586242 RepID=UPI001054554F|nr:hypothetical protein [Luteimonas arsenica]